MLHRIYRRGYRGIRVASLARRFSWSIAFWIERSVGVEEASSPSADYVLGARDDHVVIKWQFIRDSLLRKSLDLVLDGGVRATGISRQRRHEEEAVAKLGEGTILGEGGGIACLGSGLSPGGLTWHALAASAPIKTPSTTTFLGACLSIRSFVHIPDLALLPSLRAACIDSRFT